jgi:hypothetical protein
MSDSTSRRARPVPRPGRFLVPAALALALAQPPSPAAAQAPPPSSPAVTEAMGHIQRGDLAGAVQLLQKAVAADSTDGAAWSLLGYARRQVGDIQGAISAYEKALPLRPDAPGTLYNGGLALAQAGRRDEAFDWLLKAKATGEVDVTGVGLSPAADSLRGDPRYGQLYPTAADFADPFVEPVKIIHEWDGEGVGDQFGWIARDIGDVDGDGVHDVVTSAPTHGDRQAGRVYVYSGRSGALLWMADGAPGDHLGQGVEAAGDVNADGVPDVVAGAPGADRALVYSGKDGHILAAYVAMQPGEKLGHHVSGAGDVDGDGYADVLVGAPSNDAGGEDAGRAYLFSGRTGGVILTLTGDSPGDAFGSTVGGQTRSGSTLILVGAPNAGPSHKGRVYVYKALTETPAFVIDAQPEDTQLGAMFISAVGDVDGDGITDIYSSDWNGEGANGLPGAGRAYVTSGADGRLLYTLTGEARGDGFGIGTAAAGDLDADGHADLVIGSWQFGGAAPSGGKVYVYSGRNGALMRAITCKVMGDTFGFDATGIGDVDGDGVPDLLLTSAWSAVKGSHSGRMFIVSGSVATGR